MKQGTFGTGVAALVCAVLGWAGTTTMAGQSMSTLGWMRAVEGDVVMHFGMSSLAMSAPHGSSRPVLYIGLDACPPSFAAACDSCAASSAGTELLMAAGVVLSLLSLYFTLLRSVADEASATAARTPALATTAASAACLTAAAARFTLRCHNPAQGSLDEVSYGLGWLLVVAAAAAELAVFRAHTVVAAGRASAGLQLAQPLLPVHKFRTSLPPRAPLARRYAGDGEKPAIKAGDVKKLRDLTGAGMMKCKEALGECDGNVNKAQEWLRAKGEASAAKKAGRATSEGLIYSYIHTGSRLGVMVEVNCETDFVAKGDDFQQLCKDIAMQICASDVECIYADQLPPEVREREMAAEMQAEDLEGKPEDIKMKIVEGRVNKALKELVLVQQPFFKGDGKETVEQHLKGFIARLGENITIARYTKFSLGEGQ